jgi:hypothetical protein
MLQMVGYSCCSQMSDTHVYRYPVCADSRSFIHNIQNILLHFRSRSNHLLATQGAKFPCSRRWRWILTGVFLSGHIHPGYLSWYKQWVTTPLLSATLYMHNGYLSIWVHYLNNLQTLQESVGLIPRLSYCSEWQKALTRKLCTFEPISTYEEPIPEEMLCFWNTLHIISWTSWNSYHFPSNSFMQCMQHICEWIKSSTFIPSPFLSLTFTSQF